MNFKAFILIAVISAASGLLAWGPEPVTFFPEENETRPDGRGMFTRLIPPRITSLPGFKLGNGISYHNGPVMLGTPNVYYIWYGDWSGNSATAILPYLAQNIGGSPYFNINTSYYDRSNTHVSNSVRYAGSYIVPGYSHGTSLSDAAVQAIVSESLAAGGLPLDANGVYFVLTSADVAETSGFCTKYCGWHTYVQYNGVHVKYAFIGNADQCPSACSAQSVSPNGNVGADAMASIISHELEEAVTDPDLNAWYDIQGQENADKCAWTFGTTFPAAGGSRANMTLGGMNFLIQRNWVNANGGYCASSYLPTVARGD